MLLSKLYARDVPSILTNSLGLLPLAPLTSILLPATCKDERQRQRRSPNRQARELSGSGEGVDAPTPRRQIRSLGSCLPPSVEKVVLPVNRS